jgi:hypothetical protein
MLHFYYEGFFFPCHRHSCGVVLRNMSLIVKRKVRLRNESPQRRHFQMFLQTSLAHSNQFASDIRALVGGVSPNMK